MPTAADGSAPRYLAVGMADLPAHDDWLTEPEATRLRGFSYTKRREEARLGRWTAKRALGLTLGCPAEPASLRELVIRNAADGAPEVFIDARRAPVSISMTDRGDWAVCTVVEGHNDLGCDLELVEPRSDAFVRDWFTEAERAGVAASPDEHDLLANLIWSAKESALKVLRTGLRRDTRSVEVALEEFGPDGERWRPLTVTTEEGEEFDGWWHRFGEFVLTYASRTPTGPPVSLVDPPPLTTATPTHSWMPDA
ncbi:MAG: 4'-phosphopantetheinyl transferase family protein [Ilumatobacteraceae bacterium]